MTKKKTLLDFVSENTFIHTIFSILLGFGVGVVSPYLDAFCFRAAYSATDIFDIIL